MKGAEGLYELVRRPFRLQLSVDGFVDVPVSDQAANRQEFADHSDLKVTEVLHERRREVRAPKGAVVNSCYPELNLLQNVRVQGGSIGGGHRRSQKRAGRFQYIIALAVSLRGNFPFHSKPGSLKAAPDLVKPHDNAGMVTASSAFNRAEGFRPC